MAQVMMPKKQSMSAVLPFAGAAIGGIMSGGAGAGAGFKAGESMMPIADSIGGAEQDQQSAQAMSENGAMSRRMSQMDEDPLANIRDARSALSYLPPQQQKEYQPALDEAYKRALAQRQQQSGVSYG